MTYAEMIWAISGGIATWPVIFLIIGMYGNNCKRKRK